MRIYQGVDIVEVSKFKDVLLRNNDFISDIFTEKERSYCLSMKDPVVHFAGRFAAKESCIKALGTGMSGPGIDSIFKEIEIVPHPSGKPEVFMNGWAEKNAKRRKICQMTVSISHSDKYAVATAIFVGK